jgi:hypothetical protein
LVIGGWKRTACSGGLAGELVEELRGAGDRDQVGRVALARPLWRDDSEPAQEPGLGAVHRLAAPRGVRRREWLRADRFDVVLGDPVPVSEVDIDREALGAIGAPADARS